MLAKKRSPAEAGPLKEDADADAKSRSPERAYKGASVPRTTSIITAAGPVAASTAKTDAEDTRQFGLRALFRGRVTRTAEPGTELTGAAKNRYHSPQVQGQSGKSRLD
jgi:hypothetical protein